MHSSFLLSLLCIFATTLAFHPSFRDLTPKNENGGVNWAVLVAGSNTWSNYRHQSDICHAYQVLKENGFSDEYIIVMMYDDIAYNVQNPTPGKVVNAVNGPDVYNGVPHDYVGTAVTANNFYNVLQGRATTGGSGKVIASTSLDNIFVFYSDHGSVGLICMPVGPYVYSDDLSNVLKSMAANKKFNKFLFYVEACESGSMFYEGYLPSNISIFATTASTPYESSYACNYDPTRYTYLGDCYSVNWMEYTESINVQQVSVEQEFEKVRDLTTESTVCAYGDTDLSPDMLGVYMQGRDNKTLSKPKPFQPTTGTPVSQRTVEEGVLHERFSRATTEEKGKIAIEIQKLAIQRKQTEAFFFKFGVQTLATKYQTQLKNFQSFLPKMLDQHVKSKLPAPADACDLGEVGKMVFDNFECYKKVTEMVRSVCGPLDSYALQYTPIFASVCELTHNDYQAMLATTNSLCPSPIWE